MRNPLTINYEMESSKDLDKTQSPGAKEQIQKEEIGIKAIWKESNT